MEPYMSSLITKSVSHALFLRVQLVIEYYW